VPNWHTARIAACQAVAPPALANFSGGLLRTSATHTAALLPVIVPLALRLMFRNSNRMSLNTSPSKKKDGHCLWLADGQRWHIIATDGMRPWAEKLAVIMELKSCAPNGHPKFILLKMDSGKKSSEEPIPCLDSSIPDDLPRYGWKPHDFESVKLWSHHREPSVICEIDPWENDNLDVMKMRQALSPILQRAQESGGVPLHAALVEWKGMGVLLSAPRDTGKSTCCRRLPSPWQPLCDDETLIVRNHQKRYRAHPFPTWSDYLRRRSAGTWNVQRHLPLCAIFFLEQAGTDEAIPIGQGQAAMLINQAGKHVCRRNWINLDQEEERTLKKKIFDNACRLARMISAYTLRVSLSGRFWEEMERVLRKHV